MPLIDLLKDPLDLDGPLAGEFLRRAQGNILKGHGRDYTAHLFVTFGPDRPAVRRWIGGFANLHIKHAGAQLAATRSWRTIGGAGETFHAFFLSKEGYEALGVEQGRQPDDIYFQTGMKRQPPAEIRNRIVDPPVELWEGGFRNRIDAMVLVADDDRATVDARVADLTRELAPICTKLHVERGDKLVFDFGGLRTEVEIEHFGHQDGISNPRAIKQEAEKEIAEQGASRWNPTANLNLLCTADPGMPEHFGSYLVFRKLEQDVAQFRSACSALAKALDVNEELAGALAVGRFRDGRPLMPGTSPKPRVDRNDFSFDDDIPAGVCPFQSHIRKTNPRGDLKRHVGPSDDIERGFRIGRRGITYGVRPDLLPGSIVAPPSDGVGLLFMSHQSRNINFIIQQEGSDSDGFVKDGTGLDAVLGAKFDPVTGAPQPPSAQQWPLYGKPDAGKFAMANFVRMKGGEYFFAPSPQWLQSLGGH